MNAPFPHRLLVLAVLILAGRAGASARPVVEPYDQATWFESDLAPVAVDVAGNPLDYAAARIGLAARTIELPRGWEGGYRYACRFPAIDAVANRPLYLKQWAEDHATALVRAHENGRAFDWGTRVLTSAPPTSVPGYRVYDFRAEIARLRARLRAAGFGPRYTEALCELYYGYLAAREWTAAARRPLADADLAFFRANPLGFLAPDGKRMLDLTGNVASQFDWIERARRVDYDDLHEAQATIAAAVETYLRTCAGMTLTDVRTDPARARDRLVYESVLGRVVVAGSGDDVHAEDAAILIDLGGNDRYQNNAGGCAVTEAGVAVCIDHAGNDRYLAPERSFVQGCGVLGVGMLVDLAGDDVYEAHHSSQGTGIIGCGLLWDRVGNDRYRADALVQGAAMFGLGMLLDDAGNDEYLCATLGQASATTLGLGVLSDLAGDDSYRLGTDSTGDALGQSPGFGQGGALSFRSYPWEGKLTAYGGIGLLVDHAGNDDYLTRGWCDQGGSYIMSLGALVDDAGNDHYQAGTGQGSGIHVTNAILIDRQGDDLYEGGFRSGGSGGDRSPGFLIDYQGNDTYRSHTSSYGTGCKPFSFSLFIDYQGADQYLCPEPRGPITFNNWDSFGGVWPESESYLWPYAIFLDLGGDDDYQVRNRANHAERASFGHGIFLDTEWPGGDVIGPVASPLVAVDFDLPASAAASDVGADLARLQHGSTFERFGAVGRVTSAGARALAPLVEALAVSPDRQFNRDALECLHYLLVRSLLDPSQTPPLARLLRARDPEVRTIIADDIGVFRLAGLERVLVDALASDTVAAVRRFALRSLTRLKVTAALPVAVELARRDPSEDVRRGALVMVSRLADPGVALPLLARALAHDSASSVRVAAADGLGNLGRAAGVAPLRAAAASPDIYLRRAIGRSLAALGQVDGIGMLIESLTFPSIDAFYNYDRNVPNFIAAYANHDLAGDERYDQAAWRRWYARNRRRIDIRGNAAAYRELSVLADSLRDLPVPQQIATYEELSRRHPGYTRINKALAATLNQVAWDMATASPGSPTRNAEQALVYARRAVALDPQAGYYDTLAEALVACGDTAGAVKLCREMLVRFPGEPMFADRLGRLTVPSSRPTP